MNHERRESPEKQYDACPICGGAFELLLANKGPFECPNCGIRLRSFSYDHVPHHACEIDSSMPKSRMLGDFVIGHVPIGCVGCFCGETYPQTYSCCPRLLVLATELAENGTNTQVRAALDYIQTHGDTLLNCLRGRSHEMFSVFSLHRLIELMPETSFANELKAFADSIPTYLPSRYE